MSQPCREQNPLDNGLANEVNTFTEAVYIPGGHREVKSRDAISGVG
jgi:hypothetical protein